VDSDVRNLHATGWFSNIRLVQEREPEGVVLAYLVQEKPLLTQISFKGNTKIETRDLRDTIDSAVDQPPDERKLFKTRRGSRSCTTSEDSPTQS
jgi:outer membrane protein insertion porin family